MSKTPEQRADEAEATLARAKEWLQGMQSRFSDDYVMPPAYLNQLEYILDGTEDAEPE